MSSTEPTRGLYETFLGRLLERPVAVTASSLLVLGLGMAALWRLPIALLPPIEYPSLVVSTQFPSAPGPRVESTVTRRLEEAFAGLSGLVSIESRSQLGGSSIQLRFGWNTDIELTALEVRQQIDRVAPGLPDGVSRPLVLPIDPGAAPLMVLALGVEEGEVEDPIHLDRLARDVISRRLEQLSGVARVKVVGSRKRQIEVVLDAHRLTAYGLDGQQIAEALQDANVLVAGGTLRNGPFRFAVEIGHQLSDRSTVAATIVSPAGQPPVRLSQVAEVRDAMAERRGLARWNGREAVLLLVENRPDANALDVATQVRQALDVLRGDLPGVVVQPVIDQSTSVRAAIGGVGQAVLGGGLLALLTLLLFLRRPRSLLAVSLAVILSLAFTLVLFDLFAITLNLISLSGLALGVGMLVDNAIVVVESIARRREAGALPRAAARAGTAEVAGAISASSLTTMAVFLPLTLVEGLAGRLFRDQSLAVCCSLAASLCVALTVVPLVCSSERATTTGRTFDHRLASFYETFLSSCLRHPGRVVFAALLVLVGCGGLALYLPREALPKTTHGRLDVRLDLPTDASLQRVSDGAQQLEEVLLSWPEVADVLADLGEQGDSWSDPTTRPLYRGDLMVKLRSGADPEAVAARLREIRIPSDVALQIQPARTRLEALLVPGEQDLMVALSATESQIARQAVAQVVASLEGRPELSDPEALEPRTTFALRLQLDRSAMWRLGVEATAIATALRVATGGLEATQLAQRDGDVAIHLIDPVPSTAEELMRLQVPSAAGSVPLRAVARLESAHLPAVVEKINQTPVVRIGADLAPGVDVAAGMAAVEQALESLDVPGLRFTMHGANEAFSTSLEALMWSLLLSLVLVGLILAVQFESLSQPFVVLSAVPLAFCGVVVTLAVTGQSWNLMSLTGCVVLVGIAVNDAIVKIDLINQRRQQGQSRRQAIRAAGKERLRPILMTSLTTGLGLLPLALGLGEAGELRAPMAIAIVGGLFGSTVLTLTVVPTIYQVLTRSFTALDDHRVSPAFEKGI